MTRSPLLATLVPLIPLAALGWPLAKVIHQEPYQQVKTGEVRKGPLIGAYPELKTSHPFDKVEVTVSNATWTFKANETEKEIYIPDDKQVYLTVKAVWPEGTPESAILVKLLPDERLDRSYTLWGYLEATEEIKFEWDPIK